MTWNKHKKQLELALASSMRLLVLIRETIKLQPGGEQSPLYTAVAAQAQLSGVLLPDKLRMSQAEIDSLRAQLKEAPAPTKANVVEAEVRDQLKKHGIQILKPDGKGGFGV